MAALGFGGGECGAVLRLLAFILKLANVQFEPQHNIDGSIGVRLHHRYELSEACALVGVDEPALAAALCGADLPLDDALLSEESSAEGSECSGSAWEGAGSEWAAARRDRLLCALYGRLFTWLVTAANGYIKPAESGARCSLSILDVYGFERLAHNGLERLLINYAAERVQAAVTAATLRREQDEYAREGVSWTAVSWSEAEAEAADTLDGGPDSVLGVLRELAARAAADRALLPRLHRRRRPRLRLQPPDRFQVVHFAGAVTYSVRGMLQDNRDAACRRCSAALAAARDPLLAALFRAPPAAPAPGCGSPRRSGLACRQRALVGALVRRLPPAPRLVRCLRPEPRLRPHRLDMQLLALQIRTQGIVEFAMLRRNGWCESMCARALVARYGVLAPRGGGRGAAGGGAASPAPGLAPPPPPPPPATPPPPPPAALDDPVRAARTLLRSLPIPSAEFAYGRTKVFIRSPRTVWELERLRAARVAALAAVLQRWWRAHAARGRRRREGGAQRVIARAWRAYRATRELPERQALRRQMQARRLVGSLAGAAAAWAAGVAWRAWSAWARRRHLATLWRRLPARHLSPACAAWPAPRHPRLLARADRLLRLLHHRWRCRLYRQAFDQTARNRMREKVTASVLFKERKATYACSVAHPFVGDYVRLRASAAWRRGPGAAAGDRYVVFADVVGKVARSSGRVSRCLAVVSTGALLLLEPRSLRPKRRVPAHTVYRLSLSPHADDLLVVHVRACGGADSSAEELSQGSSRDAPDAPGCLFGGEGARRRRGDVVLRASHVLELATKLFLVVQNAGGAPPHVNIATEFEANFGQQAVTVSFHSVGGGDAAGARLLRRGSRMDVLV